MQFDRGGNGGGRGGDLVPPDLEEMFRKAGDFLKKNLTKAPLLIVVFLGIWLITGLYKIGVDEQGVIQRFGEYIRTVDRGLHFKLPAGIEKVTKVRVTHVYKEEFGFKTVRPGVRTQYARSGAEEALMLTGDLNTAVVEWIVQFKVKEPVKYLFKVREIRKTIRDISEAMMRKIVGDRSVTEVLTVGRIEVGQKVKGELQKILDSYEMGIEIGNVILQDVNPPDPVKPSFNEVNEAKQEKERMINEAWKAYNTAIPAAEGEALSTIKKAEGYALDRVNRAKGDAKKFIAVWNEYKKAEDVTRRRLYLETLKDVLPRVRKKYIIDPQQKSLLPLLQLTEGVEAKKVK